MSCPETSGWMHIGGILFGFVLLIGSLALLKSGPSEEELDRAAAEDKGCRWGAGIVAILIAALAVLTFLFNTQCF